MKVESIKTNEKQDALAFLERYLVSPEHVNADIQQRDGVYGIADRPGSIAALDGSPWAPVAAPRPAPIAAAKNQRPTLCGTVANELRATSQAMAKQLVALPELRANPRGNRTGQAPIPTRGARSG
jgi:hypothetical protein